jgi:SNF2 family DNA or RNA helicase
MPVSPYRHQSECLGLMSHRTAFAVLMEQGLGKTKTVIDDAESLFREKKITALLVVAPNGVHSNWVRQELPRHLTVPAQVLEYNSGKKGQVGFKRDVLRLLRHDDPAPRHLRILALNVEALSTGGYALELARRFLERYPTLMAVDESSRIKTPSAARTKRVLALGKHALYRRILTGTPITQTPFDFYAQFAFLDPGILGFNSYHAFRHRYGIWERQLAQRDGRAWRYETLVRYVNLDELVRRIAPHAYRRTKAECLDLPRKIYQVAYVEPTPLQRRLIARVLEHGVLEFDDFSELTPLQITRLLRVQQVLGGFSPSVDEAPARPLPGPNPRLDTLVHLERREPVGLTEDHPGKMVVWARFRAEINAITHRLQETYGFGSTVEFHGGVTARDKVTNALRFQVDPHVRFLVGQQRSGVGVDLFAAETVTYYSNSFSYEERYQSEDRCHRIGLKHPVIYVDLVARDTVDERIRSVLHRSHRVATDLLDKRRRLR